jgi:hypothetical protein
MSTDSQSTTISVSHLRTVEEEIELFQTIDNNAFADTGSRKFLLESIKDIDPVYEELLGCTSIDFKGDSSGKVEGRGSRGKSEIVWNNKVINVEGNTVKEGGPDSNNKTTVTENNEYMITEFPKQRSAERMKFDSYDEATTFCGRPQMNLREFYEDFLGNAVKEFLKVSQPSTPSPESDIAIRKESNPSGGISDSTRSAPFIVVDSKVYFDDDIRSIVGIYYNELKTKLIYRG